MTNLKSFQIDISTVLPPLRYYIFIARYIVRLANTTYNSSWRNPYYSSLNTINNVYYSFFEFFSLQSTTLTTGIIYGSYTISNVKYNVRIEPVRYVLNSNGTIQNNLILDGTNCKMYFYPSTDIYYTQPISSMTTNIVQFEMYFVYRDQPINNQVLLQFLSINLPMNIFDTYISNITKEQYDVLVNNVVRITNQPYNTLFKTVDTIISEEIKKELGLLLNKSTPSTTMANTNNLFEIIAVDFVNFKIYGKITITQTTNINTSGNNITSTTRETYNTIFNFANISRSGDYYIIPLTGFIMNVYPQNDLNFTNQIPNFPQQFQSYSIIIFNIKDLNNNNPDNLKNYLWNYDVFIEAHNYNLLRISDGTGAVAYST